MIYLYTLLLAVILVVSIYSSSDSEKIKTLLQAAAIFIAYSKDFFIKGYERKPNIKLMNNPSRENSKKSVVINLKFIKNGYSVKLDNLKIFPRNLVVDKILVNNNSVSCLDTIIDDNSPDAKVNIFISSESKIPRLFIIKYHYNGNFDFKLIIITNTNEC